MSQLVSIKVRSAWVTQALVIHALLRREITTRFGRYKLGIAWMLFEPLVSGLLLGLIIGGFMGRTIPEIPYVFFILNGKILLQLFSGSLNFGVRTLSSNEGLLVYRTVRPLDPFIARFIFQFLSVSLSFIVFCGISMWLGVELSFYYFHILLACAVITWLFGCGMGLIFGVAAVYVKEMEKVVMLIQAPLIFICAVLHPIDIIPQPAQDILLLNPLVHTIEQSRTALFPFYNSGNTNFMYPFSISIISLATGLIVFHVNKRFLNQK